jgi:hypothetical protein
MRFGTLVTAIVLGVGMAACGGDEASPLTLEQLEQRVPSEAEAPGSEPDPVETQVTVTGLDEFEAEILVDVPSVTDEDVRALREAGFVSAVRDTRFFPSEPGGEHVPGAPHVFTLVLQFESEEGAREAVELMHQFNLRSCPETCAFEIGEFHVGGTPNAKGAQRIATQESLDEVGDPGEPFAVYAIDFADGFLVYDITLSGPPEEVSERKLEEIATRLHERVAGAPPLESG